MANDLNVPSGSSLFRDIEYTLLFARYWVGVVAVCYGLSVLVETVQHTGICWVCTSGSRTHDDQRLCTHRYRNPIQRFSHVTRMCRSAPFPRSDRKLDSITSRWDTERAVLIYLMTAAILVRTRAGCSMPCRYNGRTRSLGPPLCVS